MWLSRPVVGVRQGKNAEGRVELAKGIGIGGAERHEDVETWVRRKMERESDAKVVR